MGYSRERMREYNREHHKKRWADPDKRESRLAQMRGNDRRNRLWRLYRLTEAEFDALYDAQGGRCAICQVSFSESQVHVDHDHVTLLVRGLLCFNCNSSLGGFQDEPALLRIAADYLEAA